MIKVDISKAVPATAFNYLAAFIPGLFFEISILLGNPMQVRYLIGQSQLSYPFGYYTQLAIAVILAFNIGNGFMFLVRLIQRLFYYVYIARTFLWNEFRKRFLLPNLIRLIQKPEWNKSRWLHARMRDLQMQNFPPALMEVQRCWHVVAAKLLQRRYGITPRQTGYTEWGIWYSVLSTLKAEDVRGSILMIAFHAAGWCGIAATHFAPILKNPYYIGFCSLLIFSGISHDWYVVRRLYSPVSAGLLRIRGALDELRETAASERQAMGRNETLSAELDDN